MIDKSQTAKQVLMACEPHDDVADVMDDPGVLVYAIPKCETCDGKGSLGVETGFAYCLACNGTGYVPVRVVPEATLRRLVNAWLGYSALVHLRDDPLIAQLIEEFADG